MIRNRFTAIAGTLLLAAMLLPGLSLAANSDKNRPSTAAPPAAPVASASTGAGWAWTNPDTGIAVTIPNGWEFEDAFGVPGFTKGAHYVGLACENNPTGISLEDYGKASRTGLAADIDLSDYALGEDPAILMAMGSDKAAGTPFTSLITAIGRSVCRLNYGSHETGPSNNINDPALSTALFISAGYKPPGDTTGTLWTNPTSGIAVTIPAEWLPKQKMAGLELLDIFEKGDVTAEYGCDPMGDDTIERYITKLKAKTGLLRFHAMHRLEGNTLFKLSGSYIKSGLPAFVYIKRVDDAFCHVLFRDESKTVSDIDEPEMTDALFASGAVPTLAYDPDMEKSSSLLKRFNARWTNPTTGAVATLPAGWVPIESHDGTAFGNYTEGYSALYFCYELPATATIKDYESYMTPAGGLRFAPIRPTGNTEVYRLDGGSYASGNALIYYAARAPSGYCSLLYRNWLDVRAEPLENAELTKAIFKTLGVDYQREPATAARTWTNPETGISIGMPAGWSYVSGNTTYFFSATEIVDLLCEDPGDFADLQDYGNVVLSTLRPDYELSPLWQGRIPHTLMAAGIARKTDKGFTSVLAKIGPRYCRVDYRGDPVTEIVDVSEPVLTNVLFASVGEIDVRAPSENRDWTNPATGRTVTLPDGWVYEEGSDPSTFLNGDYLAGLGCDAPLPNIKTLDDYRADVEGVYQEMYELEPFHPEADTLLSAGTMRSNKTPVTVVLADVGSRYCGIVYAHLGATGTENVNDAALSKALFDSAMQ